MCQVSDCRGLTGAFKVQKCQITLLLNELNIKYKSAHKFWSDPTLRFDVWFTVCGCSHFVIYVPIRTKNIRCGLCFFVREKKWTWKIRKFQECAAVIVHTRAQKKMLMFLSEVHLVLNHFHQGYFHIQFIQNSAAAAATAAALHLNRI